MVICVRKHLVDGGHSLNIDIACHVGVGAELACYAGAPFAAFLT